jgi:hypothetical protein
MECRQEKLEYNGLALLIGVFKSFENLDTFHFPFPLCSHFQDGCLLKKDWEFSDVVLV